MTKYRVGQLVRWRNELHEGAWFVITGILAKTDGPHIDNLYYPACAYERNVRNTCQLEIALCSLVESTW